MESWTAFGILAVNGISDWRKGEICLIPTAAAGFAGILWQLIARREEGVGLLLSVLLLAALSRMTEGRIGMGDGIAVGAAGIWMGFYSILRVLIWGLLMAAGAAMILLMRKSKRKELPLVPFLAAAFMTERIWVIL